MERFRNLVIGLIALFTLGSAAFAVNYTMTQGAGTTFGSLVVATVNYPQLLVCDPTTPTQCMAINASGQASSIHAAGSIASGAGVDGWDLTQGAKADAACGTATGTCSAIALLKFLNTAVTSPIPAGTNIIGKVGIDQTTPGTTNLVALTSSQVGVGATAAAPPANAVYQGALQSGATGGQLKGLISCDNHVFKHITTATDTLAVQGVASQTIYVCSWRARAAGAATWFLENTASANANCASANTQLTGVAVEATNTGETWGTNFWSGLKNTSGNGLCINSTGTGGVDVDIWYTQF